MIDISLVVDNNRHAKISPFHILRDIGTLNEENQLPQRKFIFPNR
jgi:hypothetical protein